MLIGIGGELESGKSTVANFLVQNHGFIELSFANNLKQMCMHVFGLTEDQCYTTRGKAEKLPKVITLTAYHVNQIIEWMVVKNDFHVDEINSVKMLDHKDKMKFTTPREALQLIGTEICRECVILDFHVRVIFNEIKKLELNKVVISDARFRNERKSISLKGGLNILVVDNTTKGVEDERKLHASETEIGTPEEYDQTIYNDKVAFSILAMQTKEALKDLAYQYYQLSQ